MKKLFILLFLLLSLNALAQVPNLSKVFVKNGFFKVHTSKDLSTQNTKVEKVIITVHGSVRNADTYFKSIFSLAKKKNVLEKTIVISPKIKIVGDDTESNEFVYSYEGWWIGNPSLKKKVSSFALIDSLIKKVANNNLFPNLKEIIITGHSAGGHLVQRLALGSIVDKEMEHLNIKYIVANPGTYAYLNKKRPVANMIGIFEIPQGPRCFYNYYKYGLEKLNPYMSRISIKEMIANFINRKVVYFLGEKDTGQVEQTCQAQYQGKNRFVRGQNFYAHVNEEYPENNHGMLIVPNVGHTQYGMYTSEIGQDLLFN